MTKAIKCKEPAMTVGWEVLTKEDWCGHDACRKSLPAGTRVVVNGTTFDDDRGVFCSVACQQLAMKRYIRDTRASPDEFEEVDIED